VSSLSEKSVVIFFYKSEKICSVFLFSLRQDSAGRKTKKNVFYASVWDFGIFHSVVSNY